MKNIKSKLFAVGVSAMTITPLITSCVPSSITNKLASNVIKLNQRSSSDVDEAEWQACTVSYVGKDVSATGSPIMARATDCNPKAVHLKLKHYKTNELANKKIKGKLGMEYTMPSHTLAYTSCPLSDKTSDDPTWASGMWENNGINEMGVGVSATLTCTTNSQMVGYKDDDGTFHPGKVPAEEFVKEGAGEELLPMIMAAQATSARNAMEVAAQAIKDHGAQDANIIFAVDQSEAWLMEIYTRNQFCAVKLPTDKAFIAGNEFILNSLYDMGIRDETSLKENCIHSDDLLKMPQDNSLDHYIGDGSVKDIYHLDLFNTYAQEGINDKDRHTGGINVEFDHRCHMRTWRGYTLLNDQAKGEYPVYSKTTKYDPWFTPKNSDGTTKILSPNDVINVYRDEFDNLIDTSSPHYVKEIADLKGTNDWRPIAVETTRAIHIMSSDPTRPKWIAADEWYVPSSGNYTPFLQINNAMESIDGEYGYYPERFEFNENCSAVLFRELNKLAWYDRTNYGMPLQQFWRAFEQIYNKQMDQVVKEASQLTSIADAKNIVTNFNKHVRDIYINQVKKTKNDLMWHIMDLPQKGKHKFVPLIDLETYMKELGWTNYKFDGSKATFEFNSMKATYTVSDGVYGSKGHLEINDGTTAELKDSVENGKVYVDMAGLNDAIQQRYELRKININEYLIKSNNLVWIIPVSILAAGGVAALITCLVMRKKKQLKANAKHK